MVLVVVPRATRDAELLSAVRPQGATLLVAAAVDGLEPPAVLEAGLTQGVDCLVVDLPEGGLPHAAWRASPPALPLVALRGAAAVASAAAEDGVAAARRRCDRLQADLAAWGCAANGAGLGWDWAGYLSDFAHRS